MSSLSIDGKDAKINKYQQPKLNEDQVKAAINALFSYIAKRREHIPEEKRQFGLFDEESDDILLQIALKKTPDVKRAKPIQIPIPHSLYARDGVEICLFTKDEQKEYRQKLVDEPVPNITKVIGITKLRKNYHEYKDRRALLKQFQLFLVDDRIMPMLPALLGAKFFEKKRQPLPVKITDKSGKWSDALKAARDSASLYISGPCIQVKIANSAFSKQEVLDNILTSMKSIVENIPKKWNNIQGVFLKTAESVALPLYNSLPVAELLPASQLSSSSGGATTTPSTPKKKKAKRSRNLLSNLKPEDVPTDDTKGESKRLAPATGAGAMLEGEDKVVKGKGEAKKSQKGKKGSNKEGEGKEEKKGGEKKSTGKGTPVAEGKEEKKKTKKKKSAKPQAGAETRRALKEKAATPTTPTPTPKAPSTKAAAKPKAATPAPAPAAAAAAPSTVTATGATKRKATSGKAAAAPPPTPTPAASTPTRPSSTKGTGTGTKKARVAK